MLTASIAPNRFRSLARWGLERASGLRLALLAALTFAVTVAATVAPARSAHSAPAVQRLALAAPVGEMVRAHLDAVAPAPQPSSPGTPSLETVLNPDGSLRGGLSGSFNASGFEMTYGADGGPRFVPSAASSPQAGGYANFVYNGVTSTVYAIAVVGSDVYVGGQFWDLGGVAAADYVAKWNGSAWSALDTGANGAVNALAVSGSDVYVGGNFTNIGGIITADYIAKWNTVSSSWSALGIGAGNTVQAIAVSGSDVYVGGRFTDIGGIADADYVAKWNGSAWSALGTGANNAVYALAVSGSDVYVGGNFTDIGGIADADRIAKWNTVSSSWSALGTGANDAVYAIVVGKSDVYVGGQFTDLGGIAEADNVAKWNIATSSWSALGTGANSAVNTIAVVGGDVYVGGFFTNVGGIAEADYIAKWNTVSSSWSALGTGANSTVYAIVASSSDVYVGGNSTDIGGIAAADYIAKWNTATSSWSVAVPPGNGSNGLVSAIAVSGNDVYVGGNFTDLGGIAEADRIAKWNGSAWSALGTGANNIAYAIAVSGSDVYVGGRFTDIGGIAEADYVAKWNGSAWSALGTGANSSVHALAVSGSDVYVGGAFTDIGGIADADRIAKWNTVSSSWSALGGGANGFVYAIAVSGSDVYVGGGFGTVYSNGLVVVAGTRAIAKWNGSAWSALGAGVTGAAVLALAVSGSDVYVGGQFTDLGGIADADYVAKWDGSAWSALGTGASGFVNAIAVSGSDVYVGGEFINFGGTAGANRIAKWDGNAWSALGSGVHNTVRALALGTAEPAPGAVRGRSDALVARAAQAAVPALYIGGDFTVAGDDTPAGQFTYYTGSEVLPVELVSFAGTASGRTAHLSWTTASETNNTGFVVERQTDGSWTDVSALIAGQGTTTERTDYAYDVANLTAGTHTFRLRQTDTDGTVHHSDAVTIEIGTDGQMLVTILGNGSRTPKLRIEGSGAVRAEVFDVLGRSVATVYDGLVSGTAEASLPSLSSGSYVVRVTTDGRMTSHAVVVR